MERWEYCARELLSILRNPCSESFSLYLTTVERSELIKTCIDIRFFFDWNFKFKDFYGEIASLHYPPLEFLWNVNILQIMPLENYIMNIYSDSESLKKFEESTHRLCIQDEENNVHYLVQTGILSYFVTKAFPWPHSSDSDLTVKEVCMETLKSLLQDIFSTSEKEIGTKKFTCFFSLWNAGIIEEESLINFSSFAVSYYLRLFPFVDDSILIEILEKSCSNSAPYHLLIVLEKILIFLPIIFRTNLKNLYFYPRFVYFILRCHINILMLLKLLKSDQVAKILASAAQSDEINIASLLTTVRAFLNTHKEASVFLLTLVRELMREANEKFNCRMLIRSLLIRWQIVYQSNIPSHINYKQWLQGIFKECSLSKNNQLYHLLFKVLSDFVPHHKSIECLKSAIDINLPVPLEVQNEYADYVALLKTRVQDLKPQSKPEETVEKILSLFESSGKVPPVVLEISLLQKHKFLNEFLPALLVPRMVPAIPDTKEKFILALEKAGKIPASMLLKYRKTCQEQQQIIKGTINENFSDEILIDDFDEN